MSEFEEAATAAENNTASISPTVEEIERLFDHFNKELFNSALSRPVITLSQKGTRSTKGWCTEKKVWTQLNNNSASERYYEINICPEYLNQPVEEICGVLLHEMVHLYNVINGKRDCGSNGQYHNKTFKESAEQHGLDVEKTARYGYSQTSLKPETVRFVKRLDLTAFDLYRDSAQRQPEGSGKAASTKRKSSTRSYICPKCKTLIRATKEVRVNAPPEFQDLQYLCDEIERAEVRWDARTARQFIGSLPNELPQVELIRIVHEFVTDNFVRCGLCAVAAIHRGRNADTPLKNNPHAHIIVPTRTVWESGFSKKKDREHDKKQYLEVWREQWAAVQNRAYERNRLDIRVSHESLQVQGKRDREPTIHLSRIDWQKEQNGERTAAGDRKRAITERNHERQREHELYVELAR